VLTVVGVIISFINVTFAPAVSNDTELFKCQVGNNMKENGYSCVFLLEK
jgi:uncharacterized membrane protein YgaE (UPF0421/DUF939 family)